MKKNTKKPVGRPKKKITKYRVTIDKQWKDFNNQGEAREFARKVLQNDAVYYMTCDKVEVEDETK